jgi:hypothetical protein
LPPLLISKRTIRRVSGGSTQSALNKTRYLDLRLQRPGTITGCAPFCSVCQLRAHPSRASAAWASKHNSKP